MQSRRSKSEAILPLNLEIERTCHRNRAHKHVEMAANPRVHDEQEVLDGDNGPRVNPRARMNMKDIQRPVIGASPSCIRLNAAARNYELKMLHFNMLPAFHGLPSEDPLTFIRDFYGTLQTFPLQTCSEDELRMRCFPYTLKDKAKTWLMNLPEESLTTWEQVYDKFMMKFYSPQKTAELRNKICSFSQLDGEPFHEAWDRFKMLLVQCPHHQFPKLLQIQFFYDGLNATSQTLVDTAAGGYVGDKTADEVYDIYEMLGANSQQKAVRGRRTGVYEMSAQTDMAMQVADLARQVKLLVNRGTMNREQCSFCGMAGHNASNCMQGDTMRNNVEDANYMGAFAGQQPKNDPYLNTYNPGWRNHPNFSWKDQGNLRPNVPHGFPQPRPQFQGQSSQSHEKKPQLEDMFMQYMSKMDERMTNQDAELKKLNMKVDQVASTHQAAIHNLEVQMGQLAQAVSGRAQGKLPSTTEVNPREDALAIELRSGKVLEKSHAEKRTPVTPVDEQKEEMRASEPPCEKEKEPPQEEEISTSPSPPVKPYVPPIPFPQRLRKRSDEKNFSRFLEMFKKLHINIPFVEAIAQMPSYAKFLKEIISNKRKLEEHATVALTEECSAVVQNKLPPKLKDPGSFTINCSIGEMGIEKCLCDLGASINLMPLSLFKRLGMGGLKDTTVSLQLADRSIKYPLGVVEDVLLKVGKFYFPADFLVLEMEEAVEIPIILGRPFLATGRALIDVQQGKLTLRVGSEAQEFNVFSAMNYPQQGDSCFMVDVMDHAMAEKCNDDSLMEPFAKCIVNRISEKAEEPHVTEGVMQLNAAAFQVQRGRPVIKDPG